MLQQLVLYIEECSINSFFPYLILKKKFIVVWPILTMYWFKRHFVKDHLFHHKKSFVLFVKLKWDKLFNSFLQPSGQFFNPSNVVLKKCKSCPTSNVSVERLIGQLDKKITDVFLTYKVHVLYNDNKTGNQWRRRKHWVEWSNNWVQEYIFNLLLFNFKIKMNTYFTKTNILV